MALVLYLFAILLVLAGGASGLYGADNIRAESGAAWLQLGATLFAAGFITLALAAALRELKKIRVALTEIGDDLEPAKAPPAPARAPSPAAAIPAPAFAPPGQADELEPPRRPAAPGPGEFERSVTEGAEPPAAVSVQEAHAEDRPAGPSPAASPASAASNPESPHPDPAKPNPAEAAEPEAGPEESAAPSGPATVVATYTSGGVQYFMYSDGGIEAEMEKGRYRFSSMSELRRFVETGEGGELIAPASGQQAGADAAANDAAQPDRASPAAS